MRVSSTTRHPVPSNKSQVPNPNFYPLILSRHQGEILKIPCSKSQVPSPKSIRFQVPNFKFQVQSPECTGSLGSTPWCHLDLRERSLRFLTASVDRFVESDNLTEGIQAGELLRLSSKSQSQVPRTEG